MPQSADPGAGAPHPVGEGNYIVEAGDCIFSISDRAGHLWETVWNHPRNQHLKQKRGSPHVLLSGDIVFVPPIEAKEVYRPTDARHRFVRKGTPIEFELRILNGDEPRKGVPYVVSIEGRSSSGTVPDSGIVNLKIRPSDRTGWLILRPGNHQEEYTLDFGYLDPAHAVSGAKARLRNMGLLGADDSDEAFAEALGQFQKRSFIPVTSVLDDSTARKLTEVHGS